jgi:L-glyceraldehyde 3-phosphate reductase
VTGTAQQQLRAVGRALELGVNHFDTSSVYAAGASEVNLGRALRELRADVLITTKADMTPEALLARQIQRGVRRTVEGSLVRLRRDVIDILLLHNPLRFHRQLERDVNPGVSLDDFWGEGGFLEEAVRLQNEGKVRYLGISAHEVNPALTRAVLASGTIAVFNQQFNVLNPTAAFPVAGQKPSPAYYAGIVRQVPYDQPSTALERVPAEPTGHGWQRRAGVQAYVDFDNVIQFGRTLGIGAQVTSPLAAGLLIDTVHEQPPTGTSSPTIAARWEAAHRFYLLARRYGMTLPELAFRFVLATPGIVTAIGGFANIQELDAAAESAGRGPLPADVMRELCVIWMGSDPAT